MSKPEFDFRIWDDIAKASLADQRAAVAMMSHGFASILADDHTRYWPVAQRVVFHPAVVIYCKYILESDRLLDIVDWGCQIEDFYDCFKDHDEDRLMAEIRSA